MTATATATQEKASDLAPAAVGTAGLRAEDVITPEEYYDQHEIHRLLGIGQTFANALQRSDPKRYFPWTRGGTEVKGAHVLRWLKGERIAYQITDAGVEGYKIRQRIAASKAAPVAEPVPTEQSTIDKALQQVRDSRSTEAAERESTIRHAERRYVTLLQRETLTEEETIEMAWIIRDLDLSDFQVREDRDEILPRARRLIAQHEAREDAARRAVTARDKYRDMEKRHREEERACFTAKGRAEGEARQCHEAASKLSHLRRRRPLLFQDTDPPRLIQDES